MTPRFPALLAVACGFIMLLGSCGTANKTAPPIQPLILISIDAFRWDYLEKYAPPTLRTLAANGVHATRLTPSFPTKTFPNHYTLVTGLHPEKHGIVGNNFFDPALARPFASSDPAANAESIWWGGEPIWITAERQGMRSGCFFWPGSDAPHQGVLPSFRQPYHKAMTCAARVDGLLTWLALPAGQRPKFTTLYFDIVDTISHKYGPNAPETQEAVREVDRAITRLLDGLTKLGVRDSTNLVIVSDHGMTPTDAKRVIFLDDLTPLSSVQVDFFGPTAGLHPLTGTAEELVTAIRAKAVPHLQVFLREEMPERLHFRSSPRIPSVILIADDGWSIEPKIGWPNREPNFDRGNHGYDPALPNMGALFIANGPAFKQHVKIPDVENIHLYNLLCAALGLSPAPNDGDQRLVQAALKH